jgi:hypothetical protein
MRHVAPDLGEHHYAVLSLNPLVLPDEPLYAGQDLSIAALYLLEGTCSGRGATKESALDDARRKRAAIRKALLQA